MGGAICIVVLVRKILTCVSSVQYKGSIVLVSEKLIRWRYVLGISRCKVLQLACNIMFRGFSKSISIEEFEVEEKTSSVSIV